MELEIVTIGNELLLGHTVDTNATELAAALSGAGIGVARMTTVGDHRAAIRQAVHEGLQRTGFVVTTGGLGPTRDDVSKKAVADLFDAPLEIDENYLEELRRRFARLGRGPMAEANRTQAEVPRGAVTLANRWGTAPGLWLEGGSGVVVMLPGVPEEMRKLVAAELLPRLRDRLRAEPVTVIQSRTLRTTGIPESTLADQLDDIESRLAPVRVAYLPSLHGVDLRLTAWNVPERDAAALLSQAAATLRPVLGPRCYGEGETDLAGVILDAMEAHGHRLAVAESCTGGLIGQRLTAVPGASATFLGGVVAYDNAVKERLLGVSPDVLAAEGAVSERVAATMADGVRSLFGASAALAVTGIAGPSGGSPEKPVGTVCIAAQVGDAQRAVTRRFPGDRTAVRHRAAQAALDLLRGLMP